MVIVMDLPYEELEYGIYESSAQALNEQLIEGSPTRFFVDHLIFLLFPSPIQRRHQVGYHHVCC